MKKHVVLNKNSVEGKPFINRESKSLELTIYLYIFYDEHEAISSCYATLYLSSTNYMQELSSLLGSVAYTTFDANKTNITAW